MFGAREVARCALRLDDGPWLSMQPAPGDRLWRGMAVRPALAGITRLTVQAWDATGRPGQETIELAAGAPISPRREADGSDAHAIGAWLEKGIPGTQLGPNRNAAGPT